MRRKRVLTVEQQFFLVEELAKFATPSSAVESVKETHGIVISRQLAESYNPLRRSGAGLSAELKEFFFTTRRNFISDISAIGISHQAFRLAELHKQYFRASNAGNAQLAVEILKQAAQEIGGIFTNKRNFTFDSLTNARRVLDILCTEFADELSAGQLNVQQLIEIAAKDHGLDPEELMIFVSDLIN